MQKPNLKKNDKKSPKWNQNGAKMEPKLEGGSRSEICKILRIRAQNGTKMQPKFEGGCRSARKRTRA